MLTVGNSQAVVEELLGNGLLYIAMRYVPGGDVGTMVRRDAG